VTAIFKSPAKKEIFEKIKNNNNNQISFDAVFRVFMISLSSFYLFLLLIIYEILIVKNWGWGYG
jgi:hypothetical protein